MADWALIRVGTSCGIWVGAERRLVQSAAKPNMRSKTKQPVLDRWDSNNRITPDYPIIAFEIFRSKRWASLRSAPTYDLVQHARYLIERG